MDTVQIVLGLLLLLLVGGVAYYLLQHGSQPLRPAPATRRQADLGRQSEAGFSACLFHDERAGERGSDQALGGSDRWRPHGNQAAGNGRVAARQAAAAEAIYESV